MKARIKFKSDSEKSIRFFNSEKLVDLLCETKIGKLVAFILYHTCNIECVIFE